MVKVITDCKLSTQDITLLFPYLQNASQATQIKSLETTIANLMGDKHHLVGDVDKLRDQRSRLEQVPITKLEFSTVEHKKYKQEESIPVRCVPLAFVVR